MRNLPRLTLLTLGIGGQASDGSYLYIYFIDQTLQVEGLNNPFPPLAMDYKYIFGQDDIFSSANQGGTASVTLTRYDQVKRWIDGTFSGTLIHIDTYGTTTSQMVTNGKFSIHYN